MLLIMRVLQVVLLSEPTRHSQDLGMTLGPMVMGIIIPFTGYRMMFLCLALICLINVIYFQFYVRKKYNKAILARKCE